MIDMGNDSERARDTRQWAQWFLENDIPFHPDLVREAMVKVAAKMDEKGVHDLADRIDGLVTAMPYRAESNEETARKILEKGYKTDPFVLHLYMNEYTHRFIDSLSREGKDALDEFADEIGLEGELTSYGYGGPKWEKYIDKLLDIWIEENPRSHLLWLDDSPKHLDEYGNSLLKYDPPGDREIDPFLTDMNGGYATLVTPPKGEENIPGEWFSIVPEEKWKEYRDDENYW